MIHMKCQSLISLKLNIYIYFKIPSAAVVIGYLKVNFTSLWVNSADDKLTVFLSFFPENRF